MAQPRMKQDDPRAIASAASVRRKQIRGLIWLAIAILAFSIGRAGLHRVFPAGWWRLW